MNRTMIAGVVAVIVTALVFVFGVLRREPAPSSVRVTPPPAARVDAPPPRPAPEPAPPPRSTAPSTRRVEPAPPTPAEPEPAAAPLDTSVVLTVASDVPGASVFLDREYVGTTPVTLRGLTPGSKQLNVTAEGQEGYAELITLTDGPNAVNVEFKKVRLDASIPVIHRHGVGACEGTLEERHLLVRHQHVDAQIERSAVGGILGLIGAADEGAAADVSRDEAAACGFLIGARHRRHRHAEMVGQVAMRRQPGAGAQRALLHVLVNGVRDGAVDGSPASPQVGQPHCHGVNMDIACIAMQVYYFNCLTTLPASVDS